MHQDGGNDGSEDFPGPLGNNTNVTTAVSPLKVFLWDKEGNMIAGFGEQTSSSVLFGLAFVDKNTLEIQSNWTAPPNQTLNLSYMELTLEDDMVVVSSKQGQIYVLQSSCENNEPILSLIRSINLTSVLEPGELLLNSMFDASGNIWFTTGGFLKQTAQAPGDPEQNSTTIGYIESSGTIHSMHIPNQMIENGMAINGNMIYLVTGPSGADDHADAIGYMYALTSGSENSITTVWNTTYSAGDGRKPGAFARGSGSTPTLLHDQYVVITDNANNQINLLIYHQNATANQTVCSVPIFQPGAGNNDVGALAHLDDDTYGIVLMNNYNAPPLYSGGDINGPFNNLSATAAETIRVDVKADGSGCDVAWDTPITIQSVPVMSTQTGLMYGYTQDVELADLGLYEWYVAALDWKTGKVVWEIRTGAGGSFNDNYLPGALGPDGTFYQGVLDGVVMVRDGKGA